MCIFLPRKGIMFVFLVAGKKFTPQDGYLNIIRGSTENHKNDTQEIIFRGRKLTSKLNPHFFKEKCDIEYLLKRKLQNFSKKNNIYL